MTTDLRRRRRLCFFAAWVHEDFVPVRRSSPFRFGARLLAATLEDEFNPGVIG